MTDRLCVYSLVEKSDSIYTKYHIHPNTITLFNNLVITPILFYNLYYDYYFFTMCLVWVRAYFDGLDGYIARKYEKCSKVGEIYDHFSDCLYSGYMTTSLMNKVDYLEPYSFSMGYFLSVCCIVCNYDERFHFISKFAGAGGNEDGYSFLIPFLFVFFTWSLHLMGYTNTS